MSGSQLPPEVELEDAPCPLGCGRGDQLLFVGRDRLHGISGEFAVVKCRACGLVRTNPRPTPATIGTYYPSTYRLHQPTTPSAPKPPRRRGFLRAAASRLVDFRTKPIPPMDPGTLFEFGCGNGAFLAEMAEKGWTVEGLEASLKGARSARQRGLSVQHAPLETAVPPAHPPDLVVAWMVIEHLHDPVGALTRLAGWAKPGAWLAASVPNIESLEFKAFKDAWYALQLPTHLYFYTPRTLSNVLARAGWEMKRLFHHRNLTNLITSTGYALEDAGLAPALAERLSTYPARARWQMLATYPAATLMAALGQTGRITVWARKRGA